MSSQEQLVIGSRGSDLALWQANHIAAQLRTLGLAVSIEIIRTTGDHLQTASLVQAGGKGLFTKEIEDALLAGSIDIAVHSLKDLPTEMPQGLVIAAIPEREDPRDALVGYKLDALPRGAKIGTSSLRRKSQLLALRADLDLQPIRGNVDTRLRKLREGQYDAILLAAAGLRRLGMSSRIDQTLSVRQMCPAPGQGALAVQTCPNSRAWFWCRQLDHQPTREAVTCERMILASLGGGCQLPIGAYAEHIGSSRRVFAVVVAPDGQQRIHAEADFQAGNAEAVGLTVAAELKTKGALSILSATPLNVV